MTTKNENKCVALLLAIAFDNHTAKEAIQRSVKKLLLKLPAEVVGKACVDVYHWPDFAPDRRTLAELAGKIKEVIR